jgi:hypothetical protein
LQRVSGAIDPAASSPALRPVYAMRPADFGVAAENLSSGFVGPEPLSATAELGSNRVRAHDLCAEWKASETGRDAKYYRLTSTGRVYLNSETANWERLSVAIRLILRAHPSRG